MVLKVDVPPEPVQGWARAAAVTGRRTRPSFAGPTGSGPEMDLPDDAPPGDGRHPRGMTSSAPGTTTAVTSAPPPSVPTAGSTSRRWRSGGVVLGALLVSVAISVLALATATGPVHLGGSSYDTDHAYAGPLWSLAWWLPALPAITACFSPRLALWVGGAVVVPQLVTAGVVVHGYVDGGWGSGLEFYAFAMPIALGVLSAGLVGFAALARRAALRG